jgi:hypothetical protein
MTKRKNHLLEALQAGRSYTWTEPDGGDLASMRAASSWRRAHRKRSRKWKGVIREDS